MHSDVNVVINWGILMGNQLMFYCVFCIDIILQFYELRNLIVTPDAGCVDADNGATDAVGFDCAFYRVAPSQCGRYDDDDFVSSQMCCACKFTGNIPGILYDISIYSR